MKKMMIMIAFAVGILQANVCDDKISSLQKQISIAKQFSNSEKIDGLNTALKNLQEKCNGDSIVDDLKSKISQYESKIADTKQDIADAKAKGKTIKAKAEEIKLKTVEDELSKAKKELEDYLKD